MKCNDVIKHWKKLKKYKLEAITTWDKKATIL